MFSFNNIETTTQKYYAKKSSTFIAHNKFLLHLEFAMIYVSEDFAFFLHGSFICSVVNCIALSKIWANLSQ